MGKKKKRENILTTPPGKGGETSTLSNFEKSDGEEERGGKSLFA